MKRDVYDALTADYGIGKRSDGTQADNGLDFDGLLHVDDVPRFVRAIEQWRTAVLRENGRRAGRKQTRDAVIAFAQNRIDA